MNLETISRKDYTLNKELGYILGVYLSDGSITDKNFQLQAIDKDFVEQTLIFLKNRFPNCKSSLRIRPDKGSWNKSDRYVIKVGIGDMADWIKYQTNNKHHIPLCIWDSDDVIKRWFISGVMDGDGWISKAKRKNSDNFQYRIGIGGVEEGWICEFKELLQSMGVKCNKTERFVTKNGKWFCRFHVKPLTFIENKMFFTIKRKQERLKMYGILNDFTIDTHNG